MKLSGSRRRWFGLGLLFLVGLGLRLYRLGEIPISLHWDEASWGYNAYSILKTGRDEYGSFLPIIFKAFGDYKAPVLVYLTSFSIALFGLNEFAIRFPAALFGALDLVVLVFFVVELFKSQKWRWTVGFLAGAVLCFSPWHYDYSHGSWEANILFALYLAGMTLFLRSIRTKGKGLVLAAICFGACLYVYNAAKLILPLSLLGLVVYRWRDFWRLPRKKIVVALLVGIVLALPVAWLTFKGGAGGRLKIMSAFSYPRPEEEWVRLETAQNQSRESFSVKLFHNPIEYFTEYILLRYLNHFSPRFFFFEGDWSDFRHGVPDFGVLNWLDLVLLGAAFVFLVRQKKLPQKYFLLYWLLIAPLPAALTRDIIQSLRSYFMVLPLSILAGLGGYSLWRWVKKWPYRLGWVGAGTFVFGYLFVFGLFFDRYFLHAPLVNAEYWQYGYKEAVGFVASVADQYDKIVFTDKYGQPYIYYLLHNRYPPDQYQIQSSLSGGEDGDVGFVTQLDRIEFRELYWPRDRFEPGVLYIGATYEIPDHDLQEGQAEVLKDIYFPSGKLAFRIARTLDE